MLLKGRYEVLETLSSTARLARDRRSGRQLVVKELVVKELGTWEKLGALEEEAKTLESVEHRAVPRLVDAFSLDEESPDPRFFLVREYVEGRPLSEQLGKRLPRRELLEVARQLLEIVGELHRLSPPLIHGDLSPNKVLKTPMGGFVLLGFGRASRPLGWQEEDEWSGYAAPERGHAAATIVSDLFGVAAIVYALARGRSPSELEYVGGVPQLERDLDPRLRRFFERSLLLDPEGRIASADEASQLLAKGSATLAKREPTALARPRARLSPTVATGALGALLELVLLIASPTSAAVMLPIVLGALYFSFRVEQRAGVRKRGRARKRALRSDESPGPIRYRGACFTLRGRSRGRRRKIEQKQPTTTKTTTTRDKL